MIAQLDIPKPPGDTLESWVLWLFAAVIVILAGAVVKLFYVIAALNKEINDNLKAEQNQSDKVREEILAKYIEVLKERSKHD